MADTVVNWLIIRMWHSALRNQVDVEWDLVMELVRGLWSLKMIKFGPLMGCWNLFTETSKAGTSWSKVEYRDLASVSQWLKNESGWSRPRWC